VIVNVILLGDQKSMAKIKAGLSISLTGNYSVQGIESFEGIMLWLSDTNSEGGIFLKEYNQRVPVQLIQYDDESSVDKCRDNVKKLIQEDKVDILIGPYSSSLALTACDVAEENNKTIWNHGGSTDEIEERNFTYTVNAITPASNYSHGIIDAVKKADPNANKIAAFSAENSGFSKRIANGALIHGDLKGFKVKQFQFRSGTKDFSAFTQELIDFNPDLIIGMGRAEDDLALAEYLFKSGVYSKSLALVVASINLFKEKFGNRVEGVLSASQWERRIKISPDVGPSPEQFFLNFKNVYNKEPDYLAAQGYNIGLIIEKCIIETGELDDEILREYARSASINTFYGNFKTDDKGNQKGHKMVVVQWQKGEKVIIYPESVAAAEILYPG